MKEIFLLYTTDEFWCAFCLVWFSLGILLSIIIWLWNLFDDIRLLRHLDISKLPKKYLKDKDDSFIQWSEK